MSMTGRALHPTASSFGIRLDLRWRVTPHADWVAAPTTMSSAVIGGAQRYRSGALSGSCTFSGSKKWSWPSVMASTLMQGPARVRSTTGKFLGEKRLGSSLRASTPPSNPLFGYPFSAVLPLHSGNKQVNGVAHCCVVNSALYPDTT